jgi:undecaprenyl-diphosphatase
MGLPLRQPHLWGFAFSARDSSRDCERGMISPEAFDLGVLFWFGSRRPEWLTTFMKAVSTLGNPPVASALVALAVVALALLGRARTAAFLLIAILFGLLLSETAKWAVHRPRPDVAWRAIPLPRSGSFPSGHAFIGMAFFAGLALVGPRRRPPGVRALLAGCGFGFALLLGVSRPYLGVHYPTDVLGGWTLGLACALGAYWADERWGERWPRPLPDPLPLPGGSESIKAGGHEHGRGGGEAIIAEPRPPAAFQHRREKLQGHQPGGEAEHHPDQPRRE